MNDHAADVLRLFHSIAPRRAALIVRFAGADPDDVRIARRNRDVSDGSRGLMIEDRLPRSSAIRSLPHATRGGRDVEELAQSSADLGLRPFRHREVYDASA